MFEKLRRRKEEDPRIRLVLKMDGPLIRNMDAKAADLRVPTTTVLRSAIDWYDGPMADEYRALTMEELPELPALLEKNNWPTNGTDVYFLLQPKDYSMLEQHMVQEVLSPEDAGTKILTCYLSGVENIISLDSAREKSRRDEFGFTRPVFTPPRPDPRDE